MWPVNAKAGIKKMRQYAKSTQNNNQKDKHRAHSPTALLEHLIHQVETQITE